MSLVSKFGHLVRDLKAFECMRAAVCIYFNENLYGSTNEFYDAQCKLNGISRNVGNIHTLKLIKLVMYQGKKYEKINLFYSTRELNL